MNDKWDELEALLKDVVIKHYKSDRTAMGDLIKAIHSIVTILHRLDERCGGCDQKARWKLYSRDMMFVSYSCTAHLSLLAGTETDRINALDADADQDCCYRE